LGQAIGFIFAVPFMSFIGLGYLKPKLTKRCLALLALVLDFASFLNISKIQLLKGWGSRFDWLVDG